MDSASHSAPSKQILSKQISVTHRCCVFVSSIQSPSRVSLGQTARVTMVLDNPGQSPVSIESVALRDGRFREHVDLGRYGPITTTVAGGEGWFESVATGVVDVDGAFLAESKRDNAFTWLADWRDSYDEVSIAELMEFEGEEAYAVRLKSGGEQAVTVFVSVESGLPIGRRESRASPLGPRVPTTTRMGDYREVGGMRLPFRVEIENPFTGVIAVRYERMEVDGEVDERVFERKEDGGER